MNTYLVCYRDEFSARVEAENENEAIKKFENNRCKILCHSELHQDFFEVVNANKV